MIDLQTNPTLPIHGVTGCPLRVLNLYAGIGGNRKLWEDVEVTALEMNENVAKIYQDHFPNDKVIIGDAHQYLLEHFEEFDFIWASPPCPTHSKARKQLAVKSWGVQNKPVYPDMMLYQEILFLEGYFKGKWCVENVISWYEPLIRPYEINNHYFWANFRISKIPAFSRCHDEGVEKLQERKGFDLTNYKGIDKIKELRNCVEPETGLHILDCARNIIRQKDTKQMQLF